MKIIARKSCSGKTKELIKMALEDNIPIVCFTAQQARSIQEKSQFYFDAIAPICMIEDLLSDDINIPYVLIDNADKALAWFLGEFTLYETQAIGATISVD